ncbi:MAG: hypothetical protein HY319_01545 [Armatimonadetes bacterium]|nr:hypothetical protein [Armatimonadota bacterium]
MWLTDLFRGGARQAAPKKPSENAPLPTPARDQAHEPFAPPVPVEQVVLNGETVLHEFEILKQGLGTPATDMFVIAAKEDRELPSGGSQYVMANIQQFTTELVKDEAHHGHPYTGEGGGWDYYAVHARPGGPLTVSVKVMEFGAGGHSVGVKFTDEPDRIVREVESYDSKSQVGFLTEKLWVSKADHSVHVESGNADHSAVVNRLTSTEAEALVRWNLSSVAAPGSYS